LKENKHPQLDHAQEPLVLEGFQELP